MLTSNVSSRIVDVSALSDSVLLRLQYDPFIIVQRSASGDVLRYTGLCIELLDVLAEILDFR